VSPAGGGRTPRRPDDGTVTPLLVVFAICLALMIAAVVDVSAAFLRRQATASLADGAALSASDAAAAASVYAGEGRELVPIDEGAARHAVAAYLDDSGAIERYPGLRAAVQVVGGQTIVVELTMPYDLPISVPGSRDAIVIRVQSSAELPVY
jgi:putative Flp pilus-assembly TadE/G-like protein